MRIYTDASSKQVSGIAFVATNSRNKEIYRAGKVIQESDNNTAELYAIDFALSSIKTTKEHITILTDSSYAINAIRNSYGRPQEAKLIKHIQSNMERLNVSVFWVKGHNQDGTVLSYWNKQADRTAKNVRKQYEEKRKLDKKLKVQSLRGMKNKER